MRSFYKKNNYFSVTFLLILGLLFVFFGKNANASSLIPAFEKTYREMKVDDDNRENIQSFSNNNSGVLGSNLFASPQKPVNDPYNEERFNRGSQILISSDLEVLDDVANYTYKWSIEASGDNTEKPKDNFWMDITDQFTQKSQTDGNGLPRFNFKLNLSNEQLKKIFNSSESKEYYIRVRLDIAKKIDEKRDSENGRNYIIVKFMNITEPVIMSLAKIEEDGKLDFDPENQICIENEDLESCTVIENELISAKIINDDNKYTDIKWYLDGNEIKCNQSVFALCSDNGFSDTVFFPIVGSKDWVLTLVIGVTELKTGETSQIIKKFKIINPYISIESADEQNIWEKNSGSILSSTKDKRGNEKRKIRMEALNGLNAKVRLSSMPSWLIDRVNINWYLDGRKMEKYVNMKEAVFYVGKSQGEVYNIDAEISYFQPGDLKKIMTDIWGISQAELAGKTLKDSTQVDVLKNEKKKDASIFSDPKIFFSYVLSILPGKIAFLLRLSIGAATLMAFMVLINFFLADQKK